MDVILERMNEIVEIAAEMDKFEEILNRLESIEEMAGSTHDQVVDLAARLNENTSKLVLLSDAIQGLASNFVAARNPDISGIFESPPHSHGVKDQYGGINQRYVVTLASKRSQEEEGVVNMSYVE